MPLCLHHRAQRLLADRGHRQTIGDTTVVCWAEHGETVYQDAGIAALFGPPQGVTDQDLRSVLGKLAAGEPAGIGKAPPCSPANIFALFGALPPMPPGCRYDFSCGIPSAILLKI